MQRMYFNETMDDTRLEQDARVYGKHDRRVCVMRNSAEFCGILRNGA